MSVLEWCVVNAVRVNANSLVLQLYIYMGWLRYVFNRIRNYHSADPELPRRPLRVKAVVPKARP